ncbi:MAG: peptidoglycan DD-metalloendopeptidase family protein [Eubacteriales bacterium]
MSEKFKNSKFMTKLKNVKANRAAILTTVILVAAVAVIIGVTVASNKAKKNTLPPADTGNISDTTEAPRQTEEPKNETDSVETPKQTESSSRTVDDKLPSLVLPVKGILSKQHDPTLQVYSSTMEDYRVHLGIDIVTEENAPVYAAADGKITEIWEDVKLGYCIAVQHSGDCLTVYKNLSKSLPEGISKGVQVRSGQLIATVGDSAMTEIGEEPHLHFEMTVSGKQVDPLKYYDDKALQSLQIDSSYGE